MMARNRARESAAVGGRGQRQRGWPGIAGAAEMPLEWCVNPGVKPSVSVTRSPLEGMISMTASGRVKLANTRRG